MAALAGLGRPALHVGSGSIAGGSPQMSPCPWTAGCISKYAGVWRNVFLSLLTTPGVGKIHPTGEGECLAECRKALG